MNSRCKSPLISIIAAIGPNRELGKDNKLLWHIKKDFLHFKNITLGHPIIMGRKTFESIGKPLSGRINIVISRNTPNSPNAPNNLSPLWSYSLEKAIAFAKTKDKQEIFIIGGASIYEQAIKYADKLYLTLIKGKFDADVFFPDYSSFFKLISDSGWLQEGKYQFKFLEFLKRPKLP